MYKSLKIDGIDKLILKQLMTDARTPLLQIAKHVGISGAAIHQRIKKLEESGVISGSRYLIDTKILGYKTLSFVGIFLDKAADNKSTVKELNNIPEIIECHYTTGHWSILIKILCLDNEHLMQILAKKIQPIKGVSRTETFISLEQQIDRPLGVFG